MNSPAHLVCFRLGEESFGVDICAVREIVRAQEITAVPGTAGHVLGIVNLRGKIITVVDLRKRLGLGETLAEPRSRILVVDLEGVTVGFLVDRATEVAKIERASIAPPPPELAQGELGPCIEGVGRRGDSLVVLLDLTKLLPRPDAVAPVADTVDAR